MKINLVTTENVSCETCGVVIPTTEFVCRDGNAKTLRVNCLACSSDRSLALYLAYRLPHILAMGHSSKHMFICAHCDRLCISWTARGHHGPRYCTDTCRKLAKAGRDCAPRSERRAALRMKSLTCSVCGGQFTAARVDAKTCGAACRQALRRLSQITATC